MAASPSRCPSTSRSWLYRTQAGRVICGLVTLAILAPLVPAQTGRSAKQNQGPRALGLLVLQSNGKAHLIPITILIDGKYYDASVYKAAPVPMTLWSDTVYEGIRTGVSQGLFTVTGALHAKDAKDGNEWMGEGIWQSTEALKAKATKKPAAAPSAPRGMNEDEGPPVLRRAGASNPKPIEAPAASQAQPTSTPSSNAPTTNPSPPPPSTASTASSQPDQSQPEKPPQDQDRPTLKRGMPAAPKQTEDSQKVEVASAKPPAHAGTAPSPATQAANQVQLIPAISDTHGPDLQPYSLDMKPEEEQQFRKKMLAMAADEVRVRAGLTPANPGTSGVARAPSQRNKLAAAKTMQPIFDDVQLRVFDLSNSNEPELVLTANARLPQGANKKDSASSDLEYMVTLVAREDVNGEFHKAFSNITDAQHLDVIPRLELIDVVDADGDGRGELLFREVGDAGSAFVVYRVIGDRLYPLFQGTPGK